MQEFLVSILSFLLVFREFLNIFKKNKKKLTKSLS